jgi:hypothetical protein
VSLVGCRQPAPRKKADLGRPRLLAIGHLPRHLPRSNQGAGDSDHPDRDRTVQGACFDSDRPLARRVLLTMRSACLPEQPDPTWDHCRCYQAGSPASSAHQRSDSQAAAPLPATQGRQLLDGRVPRLLELDDAWLRQAPRPGPGRLCRRRTREGRRGRRAGRGHQPGRRGQQLGTARGRSPQCAPAPVHVRAASPDVPGFASRAQAVHARPASKLCRHGFHLHRHPGRSARARRDARAAGDTPCCRP